MKAFSLFVMLGLLSYATGYGLSFINWTSANTPAYLQAVGSMVAIAIAIWVPLRLSQETRNDEKRRDADRVRRVCLAFRDELRALQKTYAGPNTTALAAVPAGEIFEIRIPVPIERFPIFNSMIGRITLIDDDVTRQAIIDAYASANALMELGFLNNELLKEHEILKYRVVNEPSGFNRDALNRNEQRLEAACSRMKALVRASKDRVDSVLPLLDVAAS